MSFDSSRYWEDRLRSRPGLEGVASLDFSVSYNRWLYHSKAHAFRRAVRSVRLNPRSAAVLDIGSGTGFYLEQWRRLGATEITGADLTETAIQRLQERFPEHAFVRLDISEAEVPLRAAAFDLVSCIDVLFHIVDDDHFRTAISNLFALVRPGGYLLFSEHLPHRPIPPAPHRVSRTLLFVERAVVDAGFVIVKRSPMTFLMDYPVDEQRDRLTRVWRALIGRPARQRVLGSVVGLLLLPVDILLTAIASEGPTTELVICQRPLEPRQ